VVGDDGLNTARLHLEARQSATRLASTTENRTLEDDHPLDGRRQI
jgi:hypothetical protein